MGGFPRVVQLVSKEPGFKRLQSVTAGTSLTHEGAPPLPSHHVLPPPTNHRCLLLASMEQQPCFPPGLTVISLQPVISLYLPAAGCCSSLFYTFIPPIPSRSDMHPVYERPDRWLVLCISKIFALGIPKPQPEENKLAAKSALGGRSIASERY